MYNYLKGILIDKDFDMIVIECNGIGYEVLTSINSVQEFEINSEVKVFTKLIIKDEEMYLIGFSSKLELEVFELLKSVSGVGIKSGLSILNTLSLNVLINCIIEEDFKSLTAVSGIGKKTAQRIVIELKDKFAKKYASEDFIAGGIDSDSVLDSKEMKDKKSEVKAALQSLGYSSGELNKVITKLDVKNSDIEDLIREALKLLMKM